MEAGNAVVESGNGGVQAANAEINGIRNNRKKNLTNDERLAIWQQLLLNVNDGKLATGAQKKIGEQFNVSERTIRTIWLKGKPSIGQSVPADILSSKKGKVGRKRKEIDLDRVKAIPLSFRKNVRSLAAQLGISPKTVWSRIKDGTLKYHSNAIKPLLSDAKKQQRLQFCIDNLDHQTIRVGMTPMFLDMMDRVHIDEKWFYMTEHNGRFILVAGDEDPEPEPHRMTKSKSFIVKVMFLCAVARPRYDRSKNSMFDGKIGIWPFVFYEPAQRSSVNRPRGTMITKPIPSIDTTVFRQFLIDKVIPAIREKWPRHDRSKGVKIQQDNARPHIKPDDLQFNTAVSSDDTIPITLHCQPPNSPDMNILDLGFFRAIQSLQYQKCAKSIDELIANVEEAFREMPYKKLNYNFLSLQQCMIETMKVMGCNRYKLPHMGKERLERAGTLPVTLECDWGLLSEVQSKLESAE